MANEQVTTDPASRFAQPAAARIQRIASSRAPLDTISLARFLLGKVVVHALPTGALGGRIVETEAYVQEDPACHAYRGQTARNRSLFLERGHAYVYLCYGTSYLLNVSSERAGVGAGVLLRALEPLFGIEHMQLGRTHVRPTDLMRGPGRLTAALRVDRRYDGRNLFTDDELWIGSDGTRRGPIGSSVRIGISRAMEVPWRFFIVGNRYLSGPRALNIRG